MATGWTDLAQIPSLLTAFWACFPHGDRICRYRQLPTSLSGHAQLIPRGRIHLTWNPQSAVAPESSERDHPSGIVRDRWPARHSRIGIV